MEAGLRAAALAVGLAALAACSGGKATPAGSGSQVPPGSGSAAAAAEPAVVTDAAALSAHAGAQVEVRGTADDAKLGAEVTLGATPVYCLIDQRWPADIAGKPVAARGRLEQTTEFADEPDPALPGAGTAAAVWVLRGCVFEGPK